MSREAWEGNLKLRSRAASPTAARTQEMNPVRELEGALLTPVGLYIRVFFLRKKKSNYSNILQNCPKFVFSKLTFKACIQIGERQTRFNGRKIQERGENTRGYFCSGGRVEGGLSVSASSPGAHRVSLTHHSHPIVLHLYLFLFYFILFYV